MSDVVVIGIASGVATVLAALFSLVGQRLSARLAAEPDLRQLEQQQNLSLFQRQETRIRELEEKVKELENERDRLRRRVRELEVEAADLYSEIRQLKAETDR